MTAPGTVDVVGTLYLAHLEPPYQHAGHYIGWTERTPDVRWAEHEAGQGSPLIRAAVAAGSTVTWHDLGPGTRNDERKLHNRHGAAGLCLTCRCVAATRRSATA